VGFGVVLLIVAVSIPSGTGLPPPPAPGLARPAPAGNPLAYTASRESDFANRAVDGLAQVLFTQSPGGVLATAARVAAFRPMIDAAVRGTDIPAALLEGLVFVESAGRPQAIAGTSAADAAGLTQILPGTAQSLLGLPVNLPRSEALTTAIENAQLSGQGAKVARLERERALLDARFNPPAELAATVRYLQIAQRDLKRLDLAVVAYHAGIGNVQNVLDLYDSGRPVPYTQLFFDTAPYDHAAAWRLLSSLGDDSALYPWRVLGAEEIMAMYRVDRSTLKRVSALETGYPSSALFLDPLYAVGTFANPTALDVGYIERTLVPLPRNEASLYLAYAPDMGSLAGRLKAPRALYRGLRPAALTMLIEIAALVHRISHSNAPLRVLQSVVDARYDARLGFDDPPATTGYTFVLERPASAAQAQALQFLLGRLQALNLTASIEATSTIEVTVASDAASVIANGV